MRIIYGPLDAYISRLGYKRAVETKNVKLKEMFEIKFGELLTNVFVSKIPYRDKR